MRCFSYSSDISSFPEADQPNSPSLASPLPIMSRHYSLIDNILNRQLPESDVRQQQQQQGMNSRKMHQSIKSISKHSASIPFQKISFEKHQIL